MAGKMHASLGDVGKDDVLSGDDDSSCLEESDIEVGVVHEPMAPPMDGCDLCVMVGCIRVHVLLR